MKRTETAVLVLLLTALFAASSGVTGAYLTKRTGQLSNLVTPGEIKVKLTEPSWEKESGENLLPGVSVPKDPAVTNTGNSDAWMFLKASVPVKTIRLVDAQSKKAQAASPVELFSFTAGDEWKLVEKTRQPDRTVYIYGYYKPLKPNETTEPLFEETVLVNYLEGELTAADKLEMPVRAFAVQTGVSANERNPAEVYQSYLKQEGSGA